MISTIFARKWDKAISRFTRGQTSETICKFKKSWLSLSIQDNRKLRTFHLKNNNGKLWVEVIIVTFLDAKATVNVLIANNDVNLLEK